MNGNASTVLVLTGMLASGKTTFLINWYNEMRRRCLPLPRMIVNDLGGGENVDAALIRAAIGDDAHVTDMTSGCIGCDDRESFLAALRGALSIRMPVVLEPSGLIDGGELGELLREAGVSPVVLCLVRVDALPDLIATGGDLRAAVDSQLKLADTVWFTAVAAGNDERETAMGYVAHVAPRAEIGGLLPRDVVPAELADRLLADRPAPRKEKAGCGCRGHHGCGHGSARSHGHGGLHCTPLPMPDGASPADIAALCAQLPGLRRMKCILDGCMVQLGIDGSFEVIRKAAMKRGVGNFFTDEPLPPDALASLRPGPEAASRTAVWLMQKLPPPLAPNGELRVITDRDWTALHLALAYGCPADTRRAVIRRYVEWRLEAATLLRGDPERWADHPKLGYWLRWLGAELALRCMRHLDLLGRGTAQRAAALRPAEMAMQGLLRLDMLTLDPEDTPENPACLMDVVRFGLDFENLDVELARRALSRMRTLIVSRKADTDALDSVIALLDANS